MNDSPGWASPGSAPSDGKETAIPRPSEPQDGSGPTGQWSPEQPPPGSGPHRATPAAAPEHGRPHPAGAAARSDRAGQDHRSAAKPGVIPLRPLSLGEILDGSVSALRAHWRTALGFSLAVSVITQIAIILMQRYLLPEPTSVDPNATGAEALRQATDSARSTLISLAPAALVTMIATLFTASIITVVISRSVLGRPTTLSDAWAEARPRILPLLGLTVLVPLIMAVIMTVGIGPGLLLGSEAGAALAFLGFAAACVAVLWLNVSFALAAPALMLERQSIEAALRRSAKLVRGAWWRTFGVLALTWLLTFLLTFLVSIPFGIIAVIVDGTDVSEFLNGTAPSFGWSFLIVTGIGEAIVSTLIYPFVGVMALLYVDQRIRREALDLDLARAAGMPGHGADTPRS